MNARMLVGAVAVFVWYMVWDLGLSGPLFGSYYAQIEGINPAPSLMWLAIGNLVAGLVLSWFYGRTLASFGVGVRGGLNFGLSAGIVMGFPIWIMISIYDTGWTYAASWAQTLANILWVLVAGILLGIVYEKMGGGEAKA
jgi:hypothetical protein